MRRWGRLGVIGERSCIPASSSGKLTGFAPYPYQERAAEELRSGQSLILRVPRGAGKTWAAVAPFLYSIEVGSG